MGQGSREPPFRTSNEKGLGRWTETVTRKDTYKKIIYRFEVIGKVFQDPINLAENVYHMDETGVMLSMPGSGKVLVGKHVIRDSRGALFRRTTMAAIDCISADGRPRSLLSVEWRSLSVVLSQTCGVLLQPRAQIFCYNNT